MTCKSKFASAFGIVSLLTASVAPAAMYAANMKLVYVQSNSALASGNAAQRAMAVRQIARYRRQTHRIGLPAHDSARGCNCVDAY